jgi:hypothetical protein
MGLGVFESDFTVGVRLRADCTRVAPSSIDVIDWLIGQRLDCIGRRSGEFEYFAEAGTGLARSQSGKARSTSQ